MVKLIISFGPQPIVKLVLIIGGNDGQQVLEISRVNRTGRVHKLEDLADAEEMKRKKRCVG